MKVQKKKTIYDLGLDKYKYILDKRKDRKIIDLSCRLVDDSLYLKYGWRKNDVTYINMCSSMYKFLF